MIRTSALVNSFFNEEVRSPAQTSQEILYPLSNEIKRSPSEVGIIPRNAFFKKLNTNEAVSVAAADAGEKKKVEAICLKLAALPKTDIFDPPSKAPSFESFGLKTVEGQLALAHIIAEEYPEWLHDCFQDLKITSPKIKLDLAKYAINSQRADLFIKKIKNSPHWDFDFQDKSAIHNLCNIIADDPNSSYKIGYALQDPRLSKRERVELGFKLEQEKPYVLAQNMGLLEIEDHDLRLRFAHKAAKEGIGIEKFDLLETTTETVRANLAKISQQASPKGFYFESFEYKIRNPLLLSQLYRHKFSIWVHPNINPIDTLTAYFSRELTKCKSRDYDDYVNEVIKKYGSAELKSVFNEIKNESTATANEHAKSQDMRWVCFAGVLALGIQQDSLKLIQPQLKDIFNLRAPVLRDKLIIQLMNNAEEVPQAKNFTELFGLHFNRPHSRIFSIPLFPLYQDFDKLSDQEIIAFNHLKTLANHSHFKDASRRQTLLDGLLTITNAKVLTSESKRALIAAIQPSQDKSAFFLGTKTEQGKKLLQSLQHAKLLIGLSEGDSDLSKMAAKGLSVCKTPMGLADVANRCFMQLVTGDVGSPSKSDIRKMHHYFDGCREPNALCTHAIHLNNNFDDFKGALFGAISSFAKDLIWPDKPQAFFRRRYDIQNSPHLRAIEKARSGLLEIWKTESLSTAKELGPPDVNGTRKQIWSVVDTDNPEDLLLSGTEVHGSCQRLDYDSSLSKTLMGTVLDGKTRMLAVKTADKRIAARRMLRLLWDKKEEKPVLLLDREYSNAGTNFRHKAAIIALAKQKARALGLPLLVSNQDSCKSNLLYPNEIHSLSCPAPFEHVDANGNQLTGGVYTLNYLAHAL